MKSLNVLSAIAGVLLMLGAQAAQPAADAAREEAAHQAHLQRQAERKRIQAERQAIQAQLGKDEAACYQTFAVNSCLRGVRSKARVADNALHRQELQINDEERREKAGERMRSIEERRQEQHDKLEAGEKPAPLRANERKSPQEREQEARQRAEQQQRRAAGHAEGLERRRQAEQQSIPESRERYEAKQQQAREHREQNERKKAEAAAAGRTPSAPLPPP